MMLAKIESQVDQRHYVLVTEPGAEFKAARYLKAEGFDPFVPSEKVTQFRRSRSMFGEVKRKVDVTKPIFRGYLFLPLNMAWSFGPLYRTPGLRSSPFMMICGHPAILPAAEVEKLKAAEQDLKDAPIQGVRYHIGDEVRITEGPFWGFTAEIAKLDDKARIELLMDILGAKRVTHVTIEQIEAVEP